MKNNQFKGMNHIKFYDDFINQTNDEMNEFFYFPADRGVKVIAIENFNRIDPEVKKAIGELVRGGSASLIDCMEMDSVSLKDAIAANSENEVNTILINMENCDPKVNDAAMDLYPEIIPAAEIRSLEDLFPRK
jgi:hypothetical protein